VIPGHAEEQPVKAGFCAKIFPPTMNSVLTFSKVSYQYPTGNAGAAGYPALLNVSLSIEEGEFVAVVGANGSGKSTFARLAGALLQPDEGFVRVSGLDTAEPASQARIHSSVGMVFQFPEDQIVATTVEEDVAFGPENLALPPAQIRARVEAALQEVGLWEHRQRPPHFLSAGQTQRLALAGVLAMHPSCILFDEASTMLDPIGRHRLMDAMRRLNTEGVTVVFITHFMEEAVQARRVIAFRKGQVAFDGTPAHLFADRQQLEDFGLDRPPAARAADALRAVLLGLPENLFSLNELLSALPAFSEAGGSSDEMAVLMPEVRAAAPGTPYIEVRDLEHVYLSGSPLAHRALTGVDLTVAEGAGHGLLGKTGSGKSTLMQHLNGLMRPQSGSVRVGPFDLGDKGVDRRDVVRKVGLVFQNPEAQFFEYYVGDEIAFGPRQLKVDESLAERVHWAMEMVGLDFDSYKDRPLFALSGGERRKVALASTLALRPEVLLLDEPTAGLDPRSRHDLLDKLVAMRSSGMTLVLSSHQMEDLALLAENLTLFDHGHSVVSGPTAEIFTHLEQLTELGLEPPVSVQVAAGLRQKGWPVEIGVLSLDELVKQVDTSLRGEVR
jgi:energy-coupling factor transport system ATP-binding protein